MGLYQKSKKQYNEAIKRWEKSLCNTMEHYKVVPKCQPLRGPKTNKECKHFFDVIF